jgi:hypothetical protein
MNLPSSQALPQSKLFQSRIGLIVLLLVVALVGVGVFFFVLRPVAPPKMPTVATSPAAVATPRPVVKQVVYGPPAPDWVPRTPMPTPTAAAPVSTTPAPAVALTPMSTVAPGAALPVPGAGLTMTGVTTVPGAATQSAPNAAVSTGTAVQSATSPAMPSAAGMVSEAPKSLDASVLFARESYVYTSSNRRDPFASLLDGRFQAQSGDGALIDVGDLHLVGIMWGASDKFALVEDTRGRGFVLRVGDPVLNGYISGISKAEIQVVQNAFGETQTLSIQLKPKEGDDNATRK